MILEALSYLSGSFPTAYLVGRAKGIDIREYGSGNPGASNVFVCLGPAAGIFTGLVDALKGFGPTWIARHHYPSEPSRWLLCAGLAIVGHLLPVWLRFRGGKGVATSFGVFLVLAPKAALIALGVFAVVARLSGFGSVGDMAAVPTALALILWTQPREVGFFALGVAAVIVFRHRENFRRLLDGTEARPGQGVNGAALRPVSPAPGAGGSAAGTRSRP